MSESVTTKSCPWVHQNVILVYYIHAPVISLVNFNSSSFFPQCKEKMRPMKKVLKQLSEPDEDMNEKEQVTFIRNILLKIGDHIGNVVEGYSDPEKIKFWRE